MLANPRHVRIALAAGMTTMIAGGLIVGASNEAAMQAVAGLGLVVIFAVFHFLDERASRREKKRAQ